MGMYDQFVIEAKDNICCSKCNKVFNNEYIQTKLFTCDLDSWVVGDYIGNNANYTLKEHVYCNDCNLYTNITIIIKDGFYIKANQNHIERIENFEDTSIKTRNLKLNSTVATLESKLSRILHYLKYLEYIEAENNNLIELMDCIVKIDNLKTKSYSEVISEIIMEKYE